MIKSKYDVVIIGAGPGGLAAAIAAKQQGAQDVLIIERDLELANEVQHGFLPDTRPDVPGYEFYDFYRPAHQVGGDYFDYISLRDGRLAVLVADWSRLVSEILL